MSLFNSQQKLNLYVKLKYMSACYNASLKNYSKAFQDFKFVLKNGSFNLKFKSLLKIIIMSI